MYDPYSPAAIARADERAHFTIIGTCNICHGPIMVSPDGEVEYCNCIDRDD